MNNIIFSKNTDNESQNFIKELNEKVTKRKFLHIFGILPSVLILLLFIAIKLFTLEEVIKENPNNIRITREYQEFISIKNEIANLRDAPRLISSNIIAKAYSGDKLSLISKTEKNWYKVLTVDNDTAYVHVNLATPIQELVEIQSTIDSNSLPHQTSNSRIEIIFQENPILRFVLLGLIGIILIFWNNYLFRVDKKRKTVKVLYDHEQVKEVQESMLSSFKKFVSSKKKWQIYDQQNNDNTKYHAGASISVDRKELKAVHNHKLPNPFFITNISIPCIELQHMELFFLPDQLLVKKSNRYAGVKYKFLEFEILPLKFRESDGVPSDSKVIDYTYQYVNKDGYPDLRFSYNPKIPICAYSEYHISFGKELNETIMTSKADALDEFVESLRKIGVRQGKKESRNKNNLSKRVEESVINPVKENTLFSKDYYNLLIDISKRLSNITDKLKKDVSLTENLLNNTTETSINEIVSYCVIYDLVNIIKVLFNGKIKTDSIEMTGLVLISGKILESETNFIEHDYESLSNFYSLGIFKNLADNISSIADKANPLNISINDNSEDENSKPKKVINSLSLPPILKISDNPLFDEYVTALYRFATIIVKADNLITKKEESALKKIYQLTHNPVIEEENSNIKISKVHQEESLEDVLNELNSLIGLNEVKKEVSTLINFVQIQKERAKQGLKSPQVSYHCVFTGSPGTGKTTIARLVAKIYKHLGILEKGHLVETDRSGLVAGFVGQTSLKVDKVIKSALDGVLFIDEAYSLANEQQTDYGDEAISTIIKRMEDSRNRLVVIAAGYPNEMKAFIDSNPGLKSRFSRYIDFPDYTPNELMKIFELFCSKSEYHISTEAKIVLHKVFKKLRDLNSEDFGNGRLVRNIFEKTIENQSNRIANVSELTKEILITIEVEDITNINI